MAMENHPVVVSKIKYIDDIYYDKDYLKDLGIEVFFLSSSPKTYLAVINDLKNILLNTNILLFDFSKIISTKKYTLTEDLQIEKYGKVKSGTIGTFINGNNICYFDMIKENGNIRKLLGIKVEHILLNNELFAPTEN